MLQAQLSSLQQSLRRAQADRQRLQVKLNGQLRQHQALVLGEVSSLWAELAALRLDATNDATVSSALPARRPLPDLPDELVGHAMSFVLTRPAQWREVSLVCRQFQRCGLLASAHECMSVVVGARLAADLGRAARRTEARGGGVECAG